MRTTGVLCATAVLSLGLLVPANAASPVADVSTVGLHWANAGFGWQTASHYSFTGVSVETGNAGDILNVVQIGYDVDSAGNPTTTIMTFGSVSGGFQSHVDTARYTAASLDATSLPATTCVYVSNDDPGTCTATSLDVHLRWTGTGPITHEANGGASLGDGSYTVGIGTSNATSRDATATGSVTGLPESAGDLQQASFGRATQVRVFVCTPRLCPA